LRATVRRRHAAIRSPCRRRLTPKDAISPRSVRGVRSHDDRLDAEINKIDLNDTPPDRIIFSVPEGDADAPPLPFRPLDLPPRACWRWARACR